MARDCCWPLTSNVCSVIVVGTSPATDPRSGLSERHECIEALTERADAWHRAISHGQRELFRIIAEMDREELWAEWGARDMAHWLWMRYGLSDWKARRWIEAAHALEQLPWISQAFATGDLGVDKVVELIRLA